MESERRWTKDFALEKQCYHVKSLLDNRKSLCSGIMVELPLDGDHSFC